MSPSKVILLLFIAMLSACSQISYYAQAAKGQWQIVSQREKIDSLMNAPDVSAELKQRLQLAQEIRNFASDSLGLPKNNSFRYYTDLERPYVVWNVIAAPPFDINPRTWCFSIAGCVAYKGYFSEDDAIELNTSLTEQGYDTYLYGVSAYSTLGWFSDPVLNTFVGYSEISLAGLIFHELAHQVVYVKGDSEFNEAFATAVEYAGVEKWIARHQQDVSAEQTIRNRANNHAITEMVLEFRNTLAQIYTDEAQSDLPQLKSNTFENMKQRYKEIQQLDKGTPFYDWWFGLKLNNAHLSSIATYHRLVPAFSRILGQSGSFTAFYETVRQHTSLSADDRSEWLNSWQ